MDATRACGGCPTASLCAVLRLCAEDAPLAERARGQGDEDEKPSGGARRRPWRRRG